MSRANSSFRARLVSAFSAEEFSSFCFDHFPEVYQELAPAMEQSQRVRLLLDYCIREKQLPALFDALDVARPEVVDDRAEITRQLTTSRTTTDRNRKVMLDKVEDFWVKGVLNQSLYREARIDLNLADAPDSVEYPWRSVIQEPDLPERTLAPGTPMIQVFDELQGSLLILGQPGAGKTTLLLELARDLIERARDDNTHPIPVVFNLSTWAMERKPIKEWMIEELRLRYDVPRKVGATWIEGDNILPLLDGLDEVAVEYRDACAAAINAYRQDEAMVPIAVCSREKDYLTLSEKLKLYGAVLIQPLDGDQIDVYLANLGTPSEGVREVLREGTAWGEVLDTPLMLAIVVLTYTGKSADELRMTASTAMLWDAYIEKMFSRRGSSVRWTQEKAEPILTRLVWLAAAMRNHNLTIFFIEDLELDWWPYVDNKARYIYHYIRMAILGCLWFGPIFAYQFNQIGWVLGLLASVVSTGIAVLIRYKKKDIPPDLKIEMVERLSWSKPQIYRGIRFGCVFGCLSGISVGYKYGPSGFVVMFVISSLYFAYVYGFRKALTRDTIDKTSIPNERVWRSGKSGVLASLFYGGVAAICMGLAGLLFKMPEGTPFRQDALTVVTLNIIIVTTIGTFLSYGGAAFIEHMAIRVLLYNHNLVPWKYKEFLEYCVDRILMRRVGGGYVFVHRMLLDHLADKYEEEHGLKGSTQIVDASQK
jgi:Effector-associated domain 7